MKQIKIDDKPVTPSKVVCIGRNYVEHIEELGNETPDMMVIFNKPNSAISDKLHFFGEDTRYEGEISFIIEDHQICGVGFGLDLTKADMQNQLKSKGLPWERAKSFDGSAVFGEFVSFYGDVATLSFELYINGELRQSASYAQMIYKPQEMIEEIESFITLEDGDIIMSGTPKGVGYYNTGDTFVSKIYSEEKLLVSSELGAR